MKKKVVSLTLRQVCNRIALRGFEELVEEYEENSESEDPTYVDADEYLKMYRNRFPKCALDDNTIIAVWAREIAKLDNELSSEFAAYGRFE